MLRFVQQKNIQPCRLTREDLIKLVAIIHDGIPESTRREDLEISTNLDRISVRENKIDEFLAHDNLPDTFSRLDISIVGWSPANGLEIDRRINLVIYDNYISLSVSGTEEYWVQGKSTQLANFFRSKRPFFWFVKTTPAAALSGVLLILIFNDLTWATNTLKSGKYWIGSLTGDAQIVARCGGGGGGGN